MVGPAEVEAAAAAATVLGSYSVPRRWLWRLVYTGTIVYDCGLQLHCQGDRLSLSLTDRKPSYLKNCLQIAYMRAVNSH